MTSLSAWRRGNVRHFIELENSQLDPEGGCCESALNLRFRLLGRNVDHPRRGLCRTRALRLGARERGSLDDPAFGRDRTLGDPARFLCGDLTDVVFQFPQ